jgi:hypothetical protein
MKADEHGRCTGNLNTSFGDVRHFVAAVSGVGYAA